ncbi:FecR family protein [Desertivirga arenae]|uniref:FecR family protein n=1 Tax=Desertivirga arenae TaxID=2810309 RepID=UPI001A969B4A|nr:FecR domain-containing protein [Pedobacter sp. SYSU D00823]
MNSQDLWILLGKKLNGEASRQELEQLENYLNSGLGNIYPIEVLEEYWRSNQTEAPAHLSSSIEKKWQRFEKRLDLLNEPEQRLDQEPDYCRASTLKFSLLSFASLSVALLVISFWYFKFTNPSELRVNEISAPVTGISKIKLPDGTKVWLNAGSKLTYHNSYGEKLREVNLIGEGYFDVVKDKEHPFLVNTPTIRLKVLGTAFNVRSYPDEEVTEAALVHGKIQVTLLNNPDKVIVMKPNEKLRVNKQSGNLAANPNPTQPLIELGYIHRSSEKDSLPTEALWMDNYLAFDSETFSQVVNKLERWYNVQIRIENPALKNQRITGRFKDESLYEALKALQVIVRFHFKITDKKVIIN